MFFVFCHGRRKCCILVAMEDPFDFQALWVVQPGRLPASRARYQVLTGDKQLLANAADTERRGWVPEFLKSLPNATVLAVDTVDGTPLLMMTMKHTAWTTEFRDPGGEMIGAIKMGDTRRQYNVLDDSGQVIAKITGDLGLKNFSLTDARGSKFATVRKARAGFLKEMLTSNDHYKIEFIGPVAAHPLRMLTVMVPIVLDLVLYEPV